tara:strand:- start:653 stop:997 length:345 start_codon:yes stop_codon:yes gene_type:complete
MKIIFKIIEYLPDTNQILVKFARQNAPKPIDDYSPVAMGCDVVDTINNNSFVESICRRGKRLVEQQENEELVLNENICEEINGTRFEDYVGKVVGSEYYVQKKFQRLKMRRVYL